MERFGKEKLDNIYQKTDGYCHLCHKKLSRKNHGKRGERGAWHVEHSVAQANGGTDHMNNLFIACIACNIEKGTKHKNSIRRKNGVTRAPHSKKKKAEIRDNNTAGGAVIGTAIGAALAGPPGAFFGGILGGLIGSNSGPKK